MALSKADLKQIAELFAATPATNKASAPKAKAPKKAKFEKKIACGIGGCDRKFASATGATQHRCEAKPATMTKLPEVHDVAGDDPTTHVSRSRGVKITSGASDAANQPEAWLTDTKHRPLAQSTRDARQRDLDAATEILDRLGKKWQVQFQLTSTRA